MTTIRATKAKHAQAGFITRQAAATWLGLTDGSHIDRLMHGRPYLAIPHATGGKTARMYRVQDVTAIVCVRGCGASELFDRATMKRTARDARKAQMDADVKTMIGAGNQKQGGVK